MKFTKEHEWVTIEGKIATVGITEHAQHQLGDIVSIDLPKVGAVATQGKPLAMIDSMKTSSPLYAPVSGTIVEVNKSLENEPQKINQSAQVSGWMVKIDMSDPKQIDSLMSEEQYQKLLGDSK